MSVFVTGANGFIAKHIILQLLAKNYKVIGSVRSKEKGDLLTKQFNNANFTYVTISDYEDEAAFEVLAQFPEITTLIHSASPLGANVTDVKEIYGPALNCTENVLNAIEKFAKNITSVVITSSIVSATRAHEKLAHYDESIWNDITLEDAKTNISAYAYSKKISEKYAWDFVKRNNAKFTLATILPSLTFGPQAFDDDIKETLNVSAEFINSIVTKGKLSFPIKTASFIDVRDVAKAHIIAFEKQLNQRLILAEDEFTTHDIVEIIKEKYPELQLPLVEQVEVNRNINNSVSKLALGFEFIKLQKSVLDATDQIMKKSKST